MHPACGLVLTRRYLVASGATVGPVGSDGRATLKVCGFLRGRPLNVNRLVHLPGVGTFQVEKVTSEADPFPLKPKRGSAAAGAVQGTKFVHACSFDGEVLAASSPAERESLQVRRVSPPKRTSGVRCCVPIKLTRSR